LLPASEPMLRGHAVITVVASRRLVQAQALLKKLNSTHRVTVLNDYRAAVSQEAVDCVYIALPNEMHYEYAKQALLQGKHVLCEKALALRGVEAGELVALARRRGLVLQEGLAYLHHPFAARLRSVVESGALGMLQGLSVQFTVRSDMYQRSGSRYKSSMGGGAMSDLGGYVFSGMFAATGRWPVSVEELTRHAWPEDERIDETMRGVVQLSSMGSQHPLNASFLYSLRGTRTRSVVSVKGSHGEIRALHYTCPMSPAAKLTWSSRIGQGDRAVPAAHNRRYSVRAQALDRNSSYSLQLLTFCQLAKHARAQGAVQQASPREHSATVRNLGVLATTGDAPLTIASVFDAVRLFHKMAAASAITSVAVMHASGGASGQVGSTAPTGVTASCAAMPPSAWTTALTRSAQPQETWTPARQAPCDPIAAAAVGDRRAPHCTLPFDNTFSAGHHTAFDKHGYIVLKSLVKIAAVKSMQKIVGTMNRSALPPVRARAESQPARLKVELVRNRYTSRGLHPWSKAVERLLLHSMRSVFFVAYELLKHQPGGTSSSARHQVESGAMEASNDYYALVSNLASINIHLNTALPGSRYQNPHADAPYHLLRSKKAVFIDVPLTDVTSITQGPLEVWPSTKNLSLARRVGAPASFTKVDANDGQYWHCFPTVNKWMAHLRSVIQMTTTGDAIVRHPSTWHRGTPNTSPHPRDMVTFLFINRRPELARRRKLKKN